VRISKNFTRTARPALSVAAAMACLLVPAAAQAQGGVGPTGDTTSDPDTATVAGAKAKIVEGGQAVAPASAPQAV
jgi:hypothetical protein